MLRAEAGTRRGALDLDIALEVAAGRCLALAGPSGAGKSTMLRIIAGLTAPRSGRVECDGNVWLDTAAGIDLTPERRGCGYVFQHYALFGHLRAWQNVAYALRGQSRAMRRARALELLERFGIVAHADKRPDSLSGGERQRVALARALAQQPSVLLLDEPLSALDARTRARASRELGAILGDIDVPTVLVTHDFAEAALLGDEVMVIDGGRIVQRGDPSELAAAPASAFVADFTGAVVLTGNARPRADGLTAVDLDGGGSVTAVAAAHGAVAVSVYPWEIAIEPAGDHAQSSARNHLAVEVVSVTSVGNRVRLGLRGSQPLAAEITEAAARELDLRPGRRVTATWKASATRLLDI